jgi:hypothetical protein
MLIQSWPAMILPMYTIPKWTMIGQTQQMAKVNERPLLFIVSAFVRVDVCGGM